jgi:hypothetical protein
MFEVHEMTSSMTTREDKSNSWLTSQSGAFHEFLLLLPIAMMEKRGAANERT